MENENLGLAEDEFGLIESDEILRSEVINAKIDVLIVLFSNMARLQVGLIGKEPREAISNFNQCTSTLMRKYYKSVKHSVEQYKARKNNGYKASED